VHGAGKIRAGQLFPLHGKLLFEILLQQLKRLCGLCLDRATFC
jgi:hypothetical protein